uniref:Uncharacterized protein n=1 Tax=Glossina palpalis gambiensis TaxID=67801 RepID=A0A1B0BHZ9_9MUSC
MPLSSITAEFLTIEPIELKKRLEEVRLLESRRSARLAYLDRDTDFARLADMGGGERRRTSHNIEVPLSTSSSSSLLLSSTALLSSSSSPSLSSSITTATVTPQHK